MSTFQLILKVFMCIILIWWGFFNIYGGKKRHKEQEKYVNEVFSDKKKKNEVIEYLLKFNEDNGYMFGILMIIYALDLIFLR